MLTETLSILKNGIKVARGAIEDATIIDAPSSTKNKDKQREPEMRQVRKGNQWYFGMKAHIGVDSQRKLVHGVAITSADVHDSSVLGDLLHGNETRVWGDFAYTKKKSVIRENASKIHALSDQRALAEMSHKSIFRVKSFGPGNRRNID